MTAKWRRVVLLLLLALPVLPLHAACRMLACDVDWGLFGDTCRCIQVGITDMNGEPQTCAIKVRTIWVTIEPGYPRVAVELCDCVFSNPCTSGPI